MRLFVFLIILFSQNLFSQAKITGPFYWFATKNTGKCEGASISTDHLSKTSIFASEDKIATQVTPPSIKSKEWLRLPLSPTGGNNLNELLNQSKLGSGDNPNTIVYGHAILRSSSEQKDVLLRLGSDDAIKVWLNGKVIHENPSLRGASDYLEEIAIDLKSGENILLVKVLNCGGGFSLFTGIQADFTVEGKKYSPETNQNNYTNATAEQAFKKARDLNYKGKIEEAIQNFDLAESLAPQNGMYSFGYAYDMYHKGKYDLAQKKYEAAINKGFDRPIVYAELGLTKKKLGEYKASIKYFDLCRETSLEYKKKAQNENKSDQIKDADATYFYCEKEKVFTFLEELKIKDALEALTEISKNFPIDEDFNVNKSRLRTGIGYIWTEPKLQVQWASANIEPLVWAGHLALVDGEYEDSLRSYKQALEFSKSSTETEKQFASWEIYKYIEITENCKKFASVKPDYIHKVAVINYEVLEGEFIFPDGTKKILKNRITEKQKRIATIMEGLVKKFFEAHSQGRLTFDYFYRYSTNASLTQFGWKENSNYPIQQSLTPLDINLNQWLINQADEFDSIIYYFPGDEIAKNAWGGSHGAIIFPYYLSTAIRGFSLFPTNWFSINSLDLFIHEFFHNRDAMNPDPSILSAGHLADGKKKYPDFKGETQYEYYKWHMQKTPVQFFKKYGYKNRYRDKLNPKIFDKTLAVYSKHQLATIKSLGDQLEIARNLRKNPKNTKAAEDIFLSIIKIMPEHADALQGLYQIEVERKNFSKALEYQLKRNDTFPSLSSYSDLGYVYRELGNTKESENSLLNGIKIAEDYEISGWDYFQLLKNTGNFYRDSSDDPKKALSFYDLCIEKTKISEEKYLHSVCVFDKGVLYGEKLGDKSQGYRLISEAISLGYDNNYSNWWRNRFKETSSLVSNRSINSEPPKQDFVEKSPDRIIEFND